MVLEETRLFVSRRDQSNIGEPMIKIVDLASSQANWMDPYLLQPILDIHGQAYDLHSFQDAKNLLIREMSASVTAHLHQSELARAKQLVSAGFALTEKELPQILEGELTICLISRACASHLPGAWSAISAFACGNTIYTFLYPPGAWQSVLTLNTIHELNHIVRYRYSRPHDSFREWLVLEGLAGLFEQELFPSENFLPGWTETSEEKLRDLLPQVKQFWDSRDFMSDKKLANAWFFGSAERGIPKQFGYALGLWLVKRARTSCFQRLSWEKLIEVPSEELAF